MAVQVRPGRSIWKKMLVKEIRFKDEYIDLILQGIKDQMRFPVIGENDNCPLGSTGSMLLWKYAGHKSQPRKEIKFIIKTTRRETLKQISNNDLIREGCYSKDEFIKQWDTLYPSKYNSVRNPDVWVVEFERVKINPWGHNGQNV